MPATSRAQQRFMGMVLAVKKGAKPMSEKIGEAAKGISLQSAKDFASTKIKKLPEHAVMKSLKKRLKVVTK